MNAKAIGYTLPRAQWKTIWFTLRLEDPFDALEGALTPEEYQMAYDELCDIGLMIPSGERVIVDALPCYLLTELSNASTALEIKYDQLRITLYKTPHMLILIRTLGARATLTPIEDDDTARSMLNAALDHCLVPVSILLRNRTDPPVSKSADDLKVSRSILDRLYAAFVSCTNA